MAEPMLIAQNAQAQCHLLPSLANRHGLITGATGTPDGRTMFINVQHPGETPGDRSDPANPRLFSNWPDQRPDGRPRSATLAIRKLDGGVIGS